jgi:hypothetical protein
MLSESISIAVQALLARQQAPETQLDEDEMSQSPLVDTDTGTNHILFRSFQLGILVSGACAILLSVFGRPIVSILTGNPEIQQSALEAVPFFCITQCKEVYQDKMVFRRVWRSRVSQNC